jgi:hypothetical protein
MRVVTLIVAGVMLACAAWAVDLPEGTPPAFFAPANAEPDKNAEADKPEMMESLTVEQAKVLIEQSDGDLSFDSLATLSPPVAKVLADFKGSLWFNGYSLTSLLPGTAKAFAEHEGFLRLGNAEQFSPELAAALSHHIGPIELVFFDENAALSHRAAKSWAQHKGKFLIFDGLTTLSDEAARALSKYKGQELAFHDLTTLSANSAKELMRFQGSLHLGGDVDLAPDVAIALTHHKGRRLSLGSRTITPCAAVNLSGYKGLNLELYSVTAVRDDGTAGVLARVEGENLTLSEQVARMLRKNPNIKVSDEFKK